MFRLDERDYGGAAGTLIKSIDRRGSGHAFLTHQTRGAAVLTTTNLCGRMSRGRKTSGIDRFRCIPSSARNMSDYKIRPSFNEKFPASKVRELIQNVLKTELAGQQYADDA